MACCVGLVTEQIFRCNSHKSVDMGCGVSKMSDMETTQVAVPHDLFHAIAEEMCDFSLDIFGTNHVDETIDDEHFSGDILKWAGAHIDIEVTFHVYAYEPHNDYAEYYAIIDGEITYNGITYSVHLNTWNGDGDGVEII